MKIKVDFSKMNEPVTEDLTQQLTRLVDEIEAEIKGKVITATVPRPAASTVPVATPAPKRQKESLDPSNLITLKELSSELKVEGRVLRKWLRKNLPKAEGRWEWKANDPEVERIRKAFKK